jgi:hypothetical protein
MKEYDIDGLISLMEKYSSKPTKKKKPEENKPEEIEEQDTAASGGGKFPKYPTVTKWESGASRGPANQIGLTKWRDIVKTTRGKGNTLI